MYMWLKHKRHDMKQRRLSQGVSAFFASYEDHAKYISTGGFRNEIKGHRINRTGH